MKSASSSQAIPARYKIAEAAQQFLRLLRQRAPWKNRSYDNLEADYNEYAEVCEQFGVNLQTSKVFEVGCGQRPYRLFYLLACGINVRALDLDRVFIRPSFFDVIQTYRENGLERAAKTTIRHLLFDQFENRQFQSVLTKRAGFEFAWPLDRIQRGSAADSRTWPSERFNFIYSEDVFEHIPADLLPEVCNLMADHLDDDGIAFIRPMIFTGIQGGHHVDWYDPAEVLMQKRSAPWDHLRKWKNPSNTYLNQVTRAQYREIFSRRFEILEERVRYPELGRELLTQDIREELQSYADDELFSNQVAFIIRRR